MSIVLSYVQLVNEDYNWWWRSFITSGGTAVYVFLYSMLYFSRLEASMFITYLLYLGYMVITCCGIGKLLFHLCHLRIDQGGLKVPLTRRVCTNYLV